MCVSPLLYRRWLSCMWTPSRVRLARGCGTALCMCWRRAPRAGVRWRLSRRRGSPPPPRAPPPRPSAGTLFGYRLSFQPHIPPNPNSEYNQYTRMLGVAKPMLTSAGLANGIINVKVRAG